MYSMCLLNRNLQPLLATVKYDAISFATSSAGTAHPDIYDLLNPIPVVLQPVLLLVTQV